MITGNSVLGTGVGLDYFRVTTPTQATPGFYRHRLIAQSTTPGHTVHIRGLNQVAGVPGAVDSQVQASSAATVPPRFIQWYTSQAGGDLFVRVTGVAATTADYSLDYEIQFVTVLSAGSVNEGARTITTVGQSAPQVDTEVWIYDSNRAAIVGWGNDDEFGTASLGSVLTRTYTPGVYYLAITNYNLANNLGSPPDDDFRIGVVTDFTGVLVNGEPGGLTTGVDLDSLLDGTLLTATKTGPYDVVFINFNVVVPVELIDFKIE